MPKKVTYPPLTVTQQALVRDNHKFVFKIVSAFRRFGHEEDLVAEGYLGLCLAAIRFDPTRNVKFTTYSVHWIRAMVFGYLLRTHGQMHILSSDRRVFFGLLRSRSALKEVPDDDAALAEHLGVDEQTVRVMQSRVTNHDVMLDAPLLDRGNGTEYLQEMVDHKPVPEERVARMEEDNEIKMYVRHALGQLDARERSIIESRDMVDGKKRTLDDLGRAMGGLSRERVRQIEKSAKAKLRRLFLQAGLPPFLTATATAPATTPTPSATAPQERARRP